MIKLLIGLLALGTLSAFAQTMIDKTGFDIISDTSTMQVLRFKDSLEFKFSKEKFKSKDLAIDFCKNHNSELDTEFNAILIAMSGASTMSTFLNESITFKTESPRISGVWQWSKEKDRVLVMLNERGNSIEVVPSIELSRFTEVSLPAICVKNL